MLNDLGALTLLGESADWLKDANAVSIRDHRLAVVEAYRAAWKEPESVSLHEALRRSVKPLLSALGHNHLYPDEYLPSSPDEADTSYLPDPANLRKDLDRLRGMLVVNKFGIGEVHLLYMTYLLCRALHAEEAPYDVILESKVGDVIFLRETSYRTDNLGAYSAELKARFHAVRILRCMKAVGLFDDRAMGKISMESQLETRAALGDELKRLAADFIQSSHHLAFVVLDTATVLEAYGRAHASSRAPADERTPEELFFRLRRHARKLDRKKGIGPERAQRLLNLSVAAIARVVAHVETQLGLKMYTFLRSSRHKPRIRHTRMFALLPNMTERLRFLNFLYSNSSRNPMYYVERFQEQFPEGKLRFVSKSAGFTVET